MPKKLSCGVLVLNDQQEILLAHVTDEPQWDIPKGGANKGETPLFTALRELEEETGVVLHEARLVELGQHPYSSSKNLHLFAVLVSKSEVVPEQCTCKSYFSHNVTREQRPEMDDFCWVSFSSVAQFCTPAMTHLLDNLQLTSILATLRSGERHAA
jgi:8-oxo-dGTP pyrophosphatase MutT (NUDIX family)